MKKYKLTTQELTTHNKFQWEIGKMYETTGEGGLCGPGWLHYYHHPLLAVFLNSIHGNITRPRLFEVCAEGVHSDDMGLKGGCTRMRLIREVELPRVTMVNRVAFGILCTKEVCQDTQFNSWADGWLSGRNRSEVAATQVTHLAADAAIAAELAVQRKLGKKVPKQIVSWATQATARAVERAVRAWYRTTQTKKFSLIEIAEKALTIR